jgi:TonB-linked SusC/RagA family outer membrane protein
MRNSSSAVVLCAMLLVLGSSGVSAQETAISGRVTDAQSGQPIGAAHISVIGSNHVALTNAEGRYTLRSVPPGMLTVRVLSIGYGEATQQVRVTPGETAALDFSLRPSAIALSPVVVTATGEQRRVEVGNAIAYVNASEVMQTRAVTNMADLLTSRAAGVQVIPGNQTGAGVRVRVRGNSSISLTNNPIYIIDGVRIEGTTGSLSVGVGGTTPARINDITPDEIESIEIARGPSASTLYGTAAANGVIVIRTKRGIAGRPQWTYHTEQTAITDRNDYPDAYWGWRTGPTAGTTSSRTNFVQCFLTQVAAGVCAQDSVTMYNLHKDKEATPYGVGYRQAHGLQVRGGTEALRYFVHGEWEDESGRLKVPEFDQRWLAARGLELRPEQRNPNALNRISARSNVDIDVSPTLSIGLNSSYINQLLRLPRSDDSGVPGLATNTYGGHGYKYMFNAAGDTLHGYRTVTPREIYGTTTEQAINRVIGAVSANWRPRDWLTSRALFGLDFISRKDWQLCRFMECPVSGQDHLGFKRDNRTTFGSYSMDAALTANRTFTPSLDGRTTVGVQFNRSTFDRNGATGRELPPGASTVSAGAIREADEVNNESRTLGAYVEQHVAWQDRVFVTGALRSDRNSAFGADFKTVFYPKLSVSWVLSDEPFFPAPEWLSQLRLRTAYGASGVQPGTTAAVEFFSDATYLGESGELPGLIYTALGNRQLKPERSTEVEVGVDGTLWNGRMSAELTYYNKNSRDALISRVLPPSLGTGATARFENLGHVRNWGWEALLDLQLIQRRSFGWDLSVNGSTNSNELVSLGGVPPIITTTQRNIEGYPLFGWWTRPLISYEDKDGNGIISWNANPQLSELVVGDTAEFRGYSMPRHEVAATTGFDFLNRRLRLATMLDYKGGHLIYNNTERIRCASGNNCRGLIDPQAPFFEQARTVAVRQFGTSALGAFFEKGDFIRWRELALTYTVPESFANRIFRGRSLVATAAARNLGILWTEYTGVDPEAFGTTGDAPSPLPYHSCRRASPICSRSRRRTSSIPVTCSRPRVRMPCGSVRCRASCRRRPAPKVCCCWAACSPTSG